MLFSKKQNCLYSPCEGKRIALQDVPDEAFASGMLGIGFAIEPSSGKIGAPLSGMVADIAQAAHAYTLRTEDNLEVLVHIGIDTVSMNGEGFSPRVQKGQCVKAGDLLAEVDLDKIRKKGLHTITVVLLPDTDRIKDVEYSSQSVIASGEPVLWFARKKG